MTYHTIVPFAIFVTLLAAYLSRESPIRPSKVDYLGAGTFSAGIVAFLVAMTEGQNWGWTSINTLGLLATSLVFFVLFLLVESRVPEPLINLTILSKRNVFFTNGGLCCWSYDVHDVRVDCVLGARPATRR